jgi:hypothetical protein
VTTKQIPQTSTPPQRAPRLTEDEVRARDGAVARGLAAIAAIGDEEEQRETLEFLRTAVNEDRLSDRKRFR